MTATATVPRLVRVASVPAEHVYPRHVTWRGDAVVHLADPAPAVDDASPGQWWPPAMLDPDWVRAHADEFDVFHIHFGFDALDPADLAAVVAALRAVGKPLVYTVHDLRNPHHATQQAHDAHLDVLVPEADALITLSGGAAREIETRWHRHAHVIPHPHVVPLARMRRRERRPNPAGLTVGLHLKSVRANMAPLATVRALLPLGDELPGLQLIIDVHRDVAEPGGNRHDAVLMSQLEQASRSGRAQLHIHDCYTDDELWDYFERLDVSVLPYRFGTHSGWLEACHDLGTTVVAPDCGYFAEQRPCLAYHAGGSGPDAASLRDAVRRAFHERPLWQSSPQARAAERRLVARRHRAIYEQLLGR